MSWMFSTDSEMLLRRTALLAAAAACLAVLALLPAHAGATSRSDVKRTMNALSGASGAYAWNITDNTGVAARGAGRARIVASNAKLFTTAAILARFGTGGRFSTGVYTDGSVSSRSTVSGNIYLRGGGDPLFGTASYVTRYFGSGATVEKLAKGLRAEGIKRITGRIYGDGSAFDGRRGTAYSGYARSGDIGGALGGLILNKGFIGGSYQRNPSLYAAQRLRSAIRAEGIRVGTTVRTRKTPRSATRLSSVRSLPMSALVRQMDKPSNNYLAEMLAKSLAMPASAADDDADGGEVPLGSRPATTRSGSNVSRRHAATFGSRVRVADGSGLSRGNRAAPREVVDLLRGVRKTVAFADFRTALPIAGVDGTLSRRMRGTAASRRCTAKTGTLSNVSTLSGYCTTRGGDLVAFSILQNRVSPGAAHSQQDRVAAAIAGLR